MHCENARKPLPALPRGLFGAEPPQAVSTVAQAAAAIAAITVLRAGPAGE
jgi:hypothetical protein